jgi:hypothetical protein
MSIRDDLDELIDWYEKYKPKAASEIPVRCTWHTLRKFCRKRRVRGGPWFYRDRVIIPIRKTRKEREAAHA